MTDRHYKGLIEHNENLNKQIMGYLQEALILLLERKNFESITITELCAKAGVSRMAFYGNYNSKEDLFEQIVRYLNKDLVDAVGNPFHNETGIEWYRNFFTVMSENAEAVRVVCSADRNRYLSTINDVVLNSRRTSIEQKYMRLIWTGGMVNATLYWLDAGMKQSVEEISEYCFSSLHSALLYYPANPN